MVIQGTQVPMYTKHTIFVFFYFSIFFLIFMKNKIKQNWIQTNKNMLNKQSIKTRLTQNMKAKHISNAHIKTRREKGKWQNHLEPFSFHTLEEPFRLANPWTGGGGEELKPFKFERNMRALRRSPKRAREDWSWFWFLDAIMPLLCWVASHL